MNIFAGGGGSEEDEAQVMARFAFEVGPGGRVLHVPWAQPNPDSPSVQEWASAALRAHGVGDVIPPASVRPLPSGLDGYDGVFIGGGNTYLLLHRLRETGLGHLLAERVREGTPCYGGSAGAIVLGAHIGTAAHMDSNDVGLTDPTGLDLFGGRALWCHYTGADAALAKGFARRTGVGVVALAEDSGLTINRDGLGAIGPGEVKAWDKEGFPYLVPRAV